MLSAEAEEAALFYAKILHLDHADNKIFKKNFFSDWKKLLPRGTQIKSFDMCDFKHFKKYVDDEAEKKKMITKRTKQRIKDEKDAAEEKYKTALVDGKRQNVGNFRVEPPGLFKGRGAHPKAGKIKRRVQPEDIIINIGKKDKIPEPPEGHEWGQIVHDNCAEWLASWKENINNDTKYVWLAQDAEFRQASDESKFDFARQLKAQFEKIREKNMQNTMLVGSGPDIEKLVQKAVALYLIDTLVLRVGNEKGADEADTVGVSSLRVEHIKLHASNVVELDFLGKDSIRFNKMFEVPKHIYQLFKQFTKSKRKGDPLFDKIAAKDINEYLKEFMPNLTAKVFRTANASYLFQQELDKIKSKQTEKVLISKLNSANAAVAIMCNHKKKVSRNFQAGLDKIKEQIKTAKDKLKVLQKGSRKTDKIKERIKKAKDKIKELTAKLDVKKAMKDVATGTSKINYIDPRITVAFAKKHKIPIDKFFNAIQQKKFEWAMSVSSTWKF